MFTSLAYGPTFKATENIGTSLFVTLDTSVDFGVALCGADEVPIGISSEATHGPPIPGADAFAAVADDELTVYGFGRPCLLVAGTGGWSPGNLLKSDTDGTGIVASSGDVVGAIALQAAAAGERVYVIPTIFTAA